MLDQDLQQLQRPKRWVTIHIQVVHAYALKRNTTAAGSSSNATGHTAILYNPLKSIFTLGGALSAFVFFGLPIRRHRDKTLLGLLLLVAIAGGAVGCRGAKANATKPTNPGTTPGDYTVTVAGSSGSIMATTAVTVTVN
jgi:hypothetical protein